MTAPVTLTLRAASIGRAFSGLQALRDVDLAVERGQIVGLIGPNGSGKTTLLNVLSGVIRPTSGRVFLSDLDVTGWPAHRMAARGVARTFQNIRLFAQMSVLENVEVGAALHPEGPVGAALRRSARGMLGETGLLDVADRRAGTLPYGVQRRVEIARALATQPSFLLLDEPAAGTNEAESDELRELIAQLRHRHGLGLLVVEHDLRLIMRLADRIIVLNEGNRIAEGTADEVRNDSAVKEAYLGRRGAQAGAELAGSAGGTRIGRA
jgi:ABC-type branched-subunit amino acid transport system ATPase component